MGALSMEQVLAEEGIRLALPPRSTGESSKKEALSLLLERFKKRHEARTTELARAYENADVRDGADLSENEVDRRKRLYRSLNKLNRSALCLSGGGIRSATFCLGVIQALAAFDVTDGTSSVSDGRPEAKNSLLGRFQYLSTVSGGGYIGSWLSSWRRYDDFDKIWTDLTSRPSGPDVEPPEISWLRAYSNYLTPQVGVGSADAWTAVAIYVRNLLLNWLVILPVLCLALLFLKFVATLSVWIARSQDLWWLAVVSGLIGVASLVIAQAFTTRHRPVRREQQPEPKTGGKPEPSPNNADQHAFVYFDLIWAVFSAFCIAIFLCSRSVMTWVEAGASQLMLFVVLALLGGAAVFAIGWVAGWPERRSFRDFALWTASGLIYGGLVGLGVYLFSGLSPYGNAHSIPTLSLPIIFAAPWLIMSQLAAEMAFVGLVSYETDSDSDREWLGRAAGMVSVAAVVWAVTAFLSVGVSYLVMHDLLPRVGAYYMTALGGISGVATALIGKSSKTPATTDNDDAGWTGLVLRFLLSIAGPVFVAVLIVGLSIALDWLLIGHSLLYALEGPTVTDDATCPTVLEILVWLAVGAIVAVVIGTIASKTVNINRFSMHAVYRNRLVRGYLGAARQARNPDRFTGFDEFDNVRAHILWPPKATSGGEMTCALFHVLNISLNVVESKRLAWQERKAEPFTVSPLHCGNAIKGFRPSKKYAGPGGISLGTAMAISGAAVSPNMGYYSSPSIALLLAFFNVRLGWWLGNPGPEGDTSYETEGPSIAIMPLIEEALGLTTDHRPYVYLSDGGHFEDLGLYEMVRRRCRFIVVVDAGEDADFAFADLGNAVRKISIDLGIRIHFDGLQLLQNRPSESLTDEERREIPYCAIGVVEYQEADGAEKGCGDGTILYIKPALHGIEAAGIASYAAAHPTFPHETTSDQWFTESQFESYRSLGFEITDRILRTKDIAIAGRPPMTLQRLLAALPETTCAAPSAHSSARDIQPDDATA